MRGERRGPARLRRPQCPQRELAHQGIGVLPRAGHVVQRAVDQLPALGGIAVELVLSFAAQHRRQQADRQRPAIDGAEAEHAGGGADIATIVAQIVDAGAVLAGIDSHNIDCTIAPVDSMWS